jgi:hypothetical protein
MQGQCLGSRKQVEEFSGEGLPVGEVGEEHDTEDKEHAKATLQGDNHAVSVTP